MDFGQDIHGRSRMRERKKPEEKEKKVALREFDDAGKLVDPLALIRM